MQIYSTPFGRVKALENEIKEMGQMLAFRSKDQWDYAIIADTEDERSTYSYQLGRKQSKHGTTTLKHLVAGKTCEILRRWIFEDYKGQKVDEFYISRCVMNEVSKKTERFKKAKEFALNSLRAETDAIVNI